MSIRIDWLLEENGARLLGGLPPSYRHEHPHHHGQHQHSHINTALLLIPAILLALPLVAVLTGIRSMDRGEPRRGLAIAGTLIGLLLGGLLLVFFPFISFILFFCG